MSIGFAPSERYVEELHLRTSSLRKRNLRHRVLGPRILRSRSKSPPDTCETPFMRRADEDQSARALLSPERERMTETRSFSRCLRGLKID
jgi:hypothetical protein